MKTLLHESKPTWNFRFFVDMVALKCTYEFHNAGQFLYRGTPHQFLYITECIYTFSYLLRIIFFIKAALLILSSARWNLPIIVSYPAPIQSTIPEKQLLS